MISPTLVEEHIRMLGDHFILSHQLNPLIIKRVPFFGDKILGKGGVVTSSEGSEVV